MTASAQQPDIVPAPAGTREKSAAGERRGNVRRRIRQAAYLVAALMTLLMLILILAAYRDDAKINSDMGTARAEVLSAGRLRSVIWFSANGQFANPPLGVLYPTNLSKGVQVEVEYYRPDPTLVRIKGRTARLAIVPALSVAAVTWAVALLLSWFCGGLRWVPDTASKIAHRRTSSSGR